MRIISGKYKGKELKGFTINGTRPTMDRVKESLFGMIQTKIKGSICLDLFAGSGALGLEALSNGAKSCYFVDHNIEAIQIVKENYNKLKVQEEVFFLKQNYVQALEYFHQANISFDLVFLDPPYQEYYIQSCIDLLEQYHLIRSGGMIICEYETEQFSCSYPCIKEKNYGTKKIRIYQLDNDV